MRTFEEELEFRSRLQQQDINDGWFSGNFGLYDVIRRTCKEKQVTVFPNCSCIAYTVGRFILIYRSTEDLFIAMETLLPETMDYRDCDLRVSSGWKTKHEFSFDCLQGPSFLERHPVLWSFHDFDVRRPENLLAYRHVELSENVRYEFVFYGGLRPRRMIVRLMTPLWSQTFILMCIQLAYTLIELVLWCASWLLCRVIC